MEKKIGNIVFYQSRQNGIQTCIFYEDGSYELATFDDGIDATLKVAREEGIKTKEELVKYINDGCIHVLATHEWETNFYKFMGKKRKPLKDDSKEDSSKSDDDSKDDEKDASKEKDKKKKVKRGSKKKKSGKKNKTLSKIWRKIKRSRLVRKIMLATAVLATALGVGAASYSCASRSTKSGQMTDSNIESSVDMNNINTDEKGYADYSFTELLEATSNKTQADEMAKIGESLYNFNEDFANSHVEEGKNIRAALTFEETVALDLAYNDYTKSEIAAKFNGKELDVTALDNAYKTATLQLMGAHVIEDKDSLVGLDRLINSQEGKDFYNKYNQLFLACKETTGQDRIDNVNAFYAELHKDFPISSEVREEGISHADARKAIEAYKVSVTPIVSAMEIMFQNLDIDHTLSDTAIDYFNDLGFCNQATERFEKAAYMTYTLEEDSSRPTYDQYEDAMIEELSEQGYYVVDDAHRDLSQLDEFKKWVNSGLEMANQPVHAETSYQTDTYSTTSSEKTETSSREEAVKKTSEAAVKEAEEKVDVAIEQENQVVKEEAMKQAEVNRQQQQAQADQETAKNNQDVEEHNKNFQDILDNINSQEDSSISEDDFGDYNVDLNGDYSDGSVKDITTDSSNASTNQELPDPNKTGENFDSQGQDTDYVNESGQVIIEYEEPVAETYMSNEEIVDAYVEAMAADSQNYEEENQYVYTK